MDAAAGRAALSADPICQSVFAGYVLQKTLLRNVHPTQGVFISIWGRVYAALLFSIEERGDTVSRDRRKSRLSSIFRSPLAGRRII